MNVMKLKADQFRGLVNGPYYSGKSIDEVIEDITGRRGITLSVYKNKGNDLVITTYKAKAAS